MERTRLVVSTRRTYLRAFIGANRTRKPRILSVCLVVNLRGLKSL